MNGKYAKLIERLEAIEEKRYWRWVNSNPNMPGLDEQLGKAYHRARKQLNRAYYMAGLNRNWRNWEHENLS